MADISKPVIVKSPIVHTCGSNLYIIHPETEAAQVKVSETTRLNEQLETINRAIAGSSAIRFTNNIAERNTLTNILPGDRVWVYNAQDDPDVGTSIPAMYIWTPDKQWKRVGEAAAINIKDFIQEDAGLVAEGNRLKVSLEDIVEENAGLALEDDKLAVALDDTLTLTPTGKVAVKCPMWNTEEWITESGEYEVLYDGIYEVTLIDGGDGGWAFSIETMKYALSGWSGCYQTKLAYYQKGQKIPVTIGAGGKGVNATVDNTAIRNGGKTSFGDLVITKYNAFCGATRRTFDSSMVLEIGGGGPGGGGVVSWDVNAHFYGGGGSALVLADGVFVGNGKKGAVRLRSFNPPPDTPANEEEN